MMRISIMQMKWKIIMIKYKSCDNCQHYVTCRHVMYFTDTVIPEVTGRLALHRYINKKQLTENFYDALGDSCEEHLEKSVPIGLIDK